MATEALIDLVSPFAELLLPGLYVAFLIGTLALLAVTRPRPRFARHARRLWLVGDLSGLAVTIARSTAATGRTANCSGSSPSSRRSSG